MVDQQGVLKPVHQAMAEARPEKNAVRKLWIERAIQHSLLSENINEPLYLTLSGAEGHEFTMLIEAGLLKVTEVNSIDSKYQHRVVAIENNHSAYTQLQTKFPGLKIIRDPIESMIHGTTRTRFPQGELEKICRSRIVNLDLDQAWKPQNIDGNWIVPVARWIEKFAEMHARAPKLGWTLFLTLHGECPWRAPEASLICDEINAITGLDNAIKNSAEGWLTSKVFSDILNDAIKNYIDLESELQQRLLMWLVPAVIVRNCAAQGWSISIQYNLHYGRPPEHAPMVTWIIDFNVPERPALNYQQELLAGLTEILNKAGYVNGEGIINFYQS